MNKKVKITVLIVSLLIIIGCGAILILKSGKPELFSEKISRRTMPEESLSEENNSLETENTESVTDTDVQSETEQSSLPLTVPTTEQTEPDNSLKEKDFQEIIDTIILPAVDSYNGVMQIDFQILDTDYEFLYQDREVYAASVAKLYLMGLIFQEIDAGHLEYSAEIDELLSNMITVSDNAAFNSLLGVLLELYPEENPFLLLDEFCADYGFDHTHIHNYYIAGSGFDYLAAYFTDYALTTSAEDVAHFYALLYHGALVSETASESMLSYLSEQERIGKIPYLLPDTAVTYNKTGEADNFSHDSALIESPACDYVLVIMSEGYADGYSADAVMQQISLDIYDYLNKP